MLVQVPPGVAEGQTLQVASPVTGQLLQFVVPPGVPPGATFSVEVPDNIPPRVYGDAHRIRQILLNLISNAIKFTPEGCVTMSANFYQDSDGQCTLEVAVRDTGIGIAEELQPILFSAFSQADSSTTRRFGGTGLGLSIVKGILDDHRATLELESKPGEGTTFLITFPA